VEYPDQWDWGVPALFTRANLDTGVPDEVRTSTTTPASMSTGVNTNPANTASSTTNAGPASDPTVKRDLVDLLTQAFPSRSDLSQLTDFYLNTSLNAIPSEANDIRSLAQGVVNWTQVQGGDTLARLLDGAIKERPARNDLKAMRDRLVAAGLITGGAQASSTNTTPAANTTPPHLITRRRPRSLPLSRRRWRRSATGG
jgi:hypothetical protein